MTRRLLALLSGVWLVLLLAEPAALHVCAVHGDGVAHASASSSHHGEAGVPRNQHPVHRHSAQCSCLGTTSHSSPVVLPPASEALVAIADAPSAIVMPVVADASLPISPDFLLPYPNGPPAAIAA